MSTEARNLLTAFDSLAPDEQQIVAAEILRRSAGTADLTDETFDGLAIELFQDYDTEEAEGARSQSG
jgi:hypothetical protein